MSNGKIDDAEIDALLTGDQRLVDRYLVTGIRELKTEVAAMRATCEARGRMCPGMHECIADPVTSPPQTPAMSRETWAMWGVGSAVAKWLGASGVGAAVAIAVNYIFYRHP